MPAKKISRQDIPKSNNNTLYFVDQSLAQFAKNYASGKSDSNKSFNTAGSGSGSCNNTTSNKNNSTSK